MDGWMDGWIMLHERDHILACFMAYSTWDGTPPCLDESVFLIILGIDPFKSVSAT